MLKKFADVVWHVSWSVTRNILVVSVGDNKVGMYIFVYFELTSFNVMHALSLLSFKPPFPPPYYSSLIN